MKALANPLLFVEANTAGHRLLEAFLTRRTHLFGVVAADGAVVGIVTLEDVLESIIGAEIVDESDRTKDMRELARRESTRIHAE